MASGLLWVKIVEFGLIAPAGASATCTDARGTRSSQHIHYEAVGRLLAEVCTPTTHPPPPILGKWETDLLLRTNLTGQRFDAGEKKWASTTHVAWRVTISVGVLPGYYMLREEIVALMDKADANRYYPRCENRGIVAVENGGGNVAARPWDDAGMAHGALPASQLYSTTDPSLAVGR
jgi:hypothetical protein